MTQLEVISLGRASLPELNRDLYVLRAAGSSATVLKAFTSLVAFFTTDVAIVPPPSLLAIEEEEACCWRMPLNFIAVFAPPFFEAPLDFSL